MDYVVSIDLIDYGGPAVHRSSCWYWNHRKPDATTMAWRGPMPTYSEAVEVARAAVRTTPAQFNPPCCTPHDHAMATGEEDPFQRVEVRLRDGGTWIGAAPDTAPESRGTRWRNALVQVATSLRPPRAFTGISLNFRVAELPDRAAHYLFEQTEAALTILVDKRRWLGNSRSSLAWWSASVDVEEQVGSLLAPGRTAPRLPSWAIETLLDVTLDAAGTDSGDEDPALGAVTERARSLGGTRLAVKLEWGDRVLAVGETKVVLRATEWLEPAVTGEDGGDSGAVPICWIACERGVKELPRSAMRVRIAVG